MDSNGYRILDTNPAIAFKVNTGLDRHHESWPQPLRLSAGNARAFMNLKPNAMAGAVSKILAQTPPRKHPSNRGVDGPGLSSGFCREHTFFFGFEDGLVDASGTRVGPAQVNRSRHIGRVSRNYSTEVEDYELIFLQQLGGR